MSASAPSEPGITAVGLLPLQMFMETRGLHWQQSLDALGIDPALAHDPDAMVPATAALQLLEVAARDCQSDSFGLEFGETLPVNLVGALAYVTLNSPDLRTMLDDMVRYNRLVVTAYTVRFEEASGFAYLTYDIPDQLGPRTQFVDLLLTAVVAHIRHVTRNPDFQINIEVQRPPPRNPELFYRVLGRNLKFDSPHNRIGIDARNLSMPLAGADPQLYRVVTRHAQDLLARRERATDIVYRVSDYIADALKHGEATLAGAAENVGMSPRALQRDLEQSGTNFRDLVDDTRKALAQHFLFGTSLPLTEISFLLGFSELSAFSRAARGWFGNSPRDMRKAARLRGAPDDGLPPTGK